jgi:hypothetical protein
MTNVLNGADCVSEVSTPRLYLLRAMFVFMFALCGRQYGSSSGGSHQCWPSNSVQKSS